MFNFFRKKKKEKVKTQIAPFDSLRSAVILIDATDPDWGQARIKSSVFYKVYNIKGENWYIDLSKRDKDDPLATPLEKSILREDAKWRRGLPATERLGRLIEETPDILISLFKTMNPQVERIFSESKAKFKVARSLADPSLADILIEDTPEASLSQEDSLDYIIRCLKKIQ